MQIIFGSFITDYVSCEVLTRDPSCLTDTDHQQINRIVICQMCGRVALPPRYGNHPLVILCGICVAAAKGLEAVLRPQSARAMLQNVF